MSETDQYKIMIVGDTSVGKSSILRRFINNTFSHEIETTIGAAYMAKKMYHNDKEITLSIWDTAGQEKYRSLMPLYYRNAYACILVFDVTDKYTLDNIDEWIDNVYKYTETNSVICLVGNKIDRNDRKVSSDDAKKVADKYNIQYFETSAKTGYKVSDIFVYVTSKITENIECGLLCKPDNSVKINNKQSNICCK